MIATPDLPFGIRCTDATARRSVRMRRTFSARLLRWDRRWGLEARCAAELRAGGMTNLPITVRGICGHGRALVFQDLLCYQRGGSQLAWVGPFVLVQIGRAVSGLTFVSVADESLVVHAES
jgi:hypothetical protein